MSNRPAAGKKPAKQAPASIIPEPNDADLRDLVNQSEFESDFGVGVVSRDEVTPSRIFGMTAGERMILSVILFMAVTVLGIALLFATGTIALP